MTQLYKLSPYDKFKVILSEENGIKRYSTDQNGEDAILIFSHIDWSYCKCWYYGELQVSEFDKHWDTHCISSYCEEDEAKIHFEAGAQSQQAKIDELQAKYDELNNRATGVALDQMTTAKLNYELQARIDGAIGSLTLVNHALLYEHIDHIINLLDGTTNEN